MIFSETSLKGAFVIHPERIEDSRGYFARVWCREEVEEHGLTAEFVQCSVSFNLLKGTLRGMHFQNPPYEEEKIVRCTKGAIYDVIIDLRPKSPTFLQWFSDVLSDQNHKMMYVPKGFAHGFQTLEDNCEVFYQISEIYSSKHSSGVRWNDPSFSIHWPLNNPIMSKRDQDHPNFIANKVLVS